MDQPPSSVLTALECGQPFRPQPAGGLTLAEGLTLTARFPPVVGSRDRTVSGTVEVTSANEVVRGVVTPGADVFLVRDGHIATLPLPQDLVGMRLDLAAGDVERLPAQATLAPCDRAGGGALPTGTYELYARVVLHRDDGSSLESIGGPWPLEVR